MTAEPVEDLVHGIAKVDAEIIELVELRTRLEQECQRFRLSQGRPRFVHSGEIEVCNRYRRLGAEGRNLALALIRLSHADPGQVSARAGVRRALGAVARRAGRQRR